MENGLNQRRVSFSSPQSHKETRDDEFVTAVAAATFSIYSLEEAGILDLKKIRDSPKFSKNQSIARQPSYVHFWAPTFKWGISIANIADFSKPPDMISYPQQIAVMATGLIWANYSTVITPSKTTVARYDLTEANMYCFKDIFIKAWLR
ncbi:hypothetical protein RYX36_026487 [Vicia faba]